MYENENFPEHIGWGHSTWQEGCRLATSVLPGQLIITHHDPVNTDDVLRELEGKAKEIYADTYFARAGDQFAL